MKSPALASLSFLCSLLVSGCVGVDLGPDPTLVNAGAAGTNWGVIASAGPGLYAGESVVDASAGARDQAAAAKLAAASEAKKAEQVARAKADAKASAAKTVAAAAAAAQGQGQAGTARPKDFDQDGVPDNQDKCVDRPETKNGFQDADGCPDEVPKALQAFTGVIKGIRFDSGTDQIKDSSTNSLNKALRALREFPDTKLRIEGHSDGAGDPGFNKRLSLKRANAVKSWFVRKGIAASRLATAGMGPDKPIASNDTANGRARNRRIEFKLVQ